MCCQWLNVLSVAETEAMCVCVNVLYGVKEKLNEEGLNEM
jgi:hypothetical protein